MPGSLRDTAALLLQINWSAADAWESQAKALLTEHYRRALPYWPPDRPWFHPGDAEIREAVLGRLDRPTREAIDDTAEQTRVEIRATGARLEDITSSCLPLVFAWQELVARGELSQAENPAGPLLDLFRRGFQLGTEHTGLEVSYATGWVTIPFITRKAVLREG